MNDHIPIYLFSPHICMYVGILGAATGLGFIFGAISGIGFSRVSLIFPFIIAGIVTLLNTIFAYYIFMCPVVIATVDHVRQMKHHHIIH